jgi:hypothetical protein
LNLIKAYCLSALLLAAPACSMVSSLRVDAQALPRLESAKGRVFIYRTSTFGSESAPEVLLNGDKLGKLDRDSVIFRDVLPGSYAVTTTMTAKVVHFSMRAGEKKYVKLDRDLFGSHTYPELIDSAQGEAEASRLRIMSQGRK